MRPEDNSFVVGGSDDNVPTIPAISSTRRRAGNAGTIIPIDAIQEFNTEENPPPDGWKRRDSQHRAEIGIRFTGGLRI
jgi:hypothetical protein